MKDKNLPPDINLDSLDDLTNQANQIIEQLENEKDLNNSIDSYQKLLKLNNIIEKKFKNSVKDINEKTKENILKIISKKNAKKVK